jgi:hypothetical protein
MSNIYKRKYSIKKIKEQLSQVEESGEEKIDIENLLDLIGYDLVDMYFYYVNYIRGRFRYGKEYKDRRD